MSLKLDNCTVSRAAERLLIELATDLAAAPDADPRRAPPRLPRRAAPDDRAETSRWPELV